MKMATAGGHWNPNQVGEDEKEGETEAKAASVITVVGSGFGLEAYFATTPVLSTFSGLWRPTLMVWGSLE